MSRTEGRSKVPGSVAALAELLGESPGIMAVREQIARLLERPLDARRLPPILIQGETGTGKGLVARAIHRAGLRAAGPFVDVNCAAIPETLLEAELFGFERGAFTDARQAKAGLFQAAHRGTLFLDEIGLLPEGLQGKLLTVLEERSVRRLGSTRSEPVDVWVLAATGADLEAATRARRFREDLYHRLAVLRVWLPPLRERGEDILLLAEHFLARACADYNLPAKTLAPDAQAALMAYGWPGNIRELANVMERVALLAEAAVVTAAMLGLPAAPRGEGRGLARTEPAVGLKEAVGSVEREHLLEVLQQTDWNITRAAARLRVSRNTLRYRIEKYELRPGEAPPAPRRPVERPGIPVPAVPAAVPPERPEPPVVRWERRRLTLLRVALIVPPGEPLGDTSRALDVIIEKVRSFGGRVEELSPTGVLATFGIEPVEDAPRRAALAAMAILKAAERAGRADAEQVAGKIAIHVGQFLVGQVGGAVQIDLEGKRKAWAVVDALAEGAEPGSILVSGGAAPFLERRFDLVPVGDLGGAAGRTYRLAGREDLGLGLGGRMTRFVGRDHELELLQSRLASAMRGQGQVVGIMGDSGIGKSRLLFEFRQSLEGKQVTYFEGCCVSYGSSIPYLPVLDIIRQNCGITETDTPEAIMEKVRVTLSEVEMGPEEGATYLLQLLGVKEGTERLAWLSPEALKARALETLRQITLKGSRRRPIIIAVEDFHWIDTSSEEYFAALAESLAGAPILFLLTYRPGYRPPWTDKSYATQIALQPLAPQESLSVIQSVLRTDYITDAVVEVLLAKAEGNPFFLEELARAIREQGGLSPTLAVPDTIQEVLLARIDRLPDEPKRLLQAVSILGREVLLRLLGAIWEGPGAIEPYLRELTQLEFLYEQTGGEEPVFVFKHVMTQEVAYASLLEGRRRAYHATVGRALEELYAGRTNEVVELLAHHFGRSGEDEKAVDCAILAGEKAQRRWANTEALAYFETALKRLEGMPDSELNRLRRIDAVIKQAEVKFALGRHAEHIKALEGIRDLVGAVADPPRRAAWYYWTAFLQSITGGPPEVAIAYCREAATIADAGGLDEIKALVECCLTHVYAMAGNFRDAVAAGERALMTFEARGNIWWACRTLWGLSIATIYLGEWGRSLEYCRRALEHGHAVNDLRLKAVSWWRAGWTHIQRGDPEAGLRCCKEALALSPGPFDAAMAEAAQGYGLIKAGQVAAGVAELAEAVAWFDQSHLRLTRSSFGLWLGDGYVRQGMLSQARAIFEEVLATSREVGYRHLEGIAHRLLGESFARENPTAAANHLEEAIRILEEVEARNELAKALVTKADLRQAAGDLAGARQLLDRALVIFEALGALDEPPRVRAAIAALDQRSST